MVALVLPIPVGFGGPLPAHCPCQAGAGGPSTYLKLSELITSTGSSFPAQWGPAGPGACGRLLSADCSVPHRG